MTLLFTSGKSVKDKVIITLGYLWPLKIKEILNYIKHNFNSNVTYQAVYKSVNELIDEGVVVKTENGYVLNKSWVGSLKEYMTYVDQSYKTDTSKKEITSSEQVIIESLYDFYIYVLIMLEKFSNDKYATSVPCVFRAVHAWNALVIGKEEFMRVAKCVPKYNMYAIISADTPLDQALAKYWEKLHGHFKTNVPRHITNDVVVIGDYVVQIIYPPDLINALDSFFKETKSVEEMDISRFQKDIFYQKMSIPIVTVKNKTLADNIRKDTIEFFK